MSYYYFGVYFVVVRALETSKIDRIDLKTDIFNSFFCWHDYNALASRKHRL